MSLLKKIGRAMLALVVTPVLGVVISIAVLIFVVVLTLLIPIAILMGTEDELHSNIQESFKKL